MTNLAFLGTGLIGSALVEAATRRGERVTVWNRSRAKADALAHLGVGVADTPLAAAGGADRVHLALSDDAAVDSVLAACGEALAGPLVIDHSTTSPAGTAARAARLEARGVSFLHAPVFMSPAMCRDMKGLMLCAGPQALFARAEPDLRAMTGTLEYTGERPDLAAAYKLFGNAMIIAVSAAFADVLALARSLDVPASAAHALFSRINPASTLAYRGAAMAKGDFRASFELSMARKDLRLMLEAAGDSHLAVLPGIAARIDQLLGQGLGPEDLGVLAIDAVRRSGN